MCVYEETPTPFILKISDVIFEDINSLSLPFSSSHYIILYLSFLSYPFLSLYLLFNLSGTSLCFLLTWSSYKEIYSSLNLIIENKWYKIVKIGKLYIIYNAFCIHKKLLITVILFNNYYRIFKCRPFVLSSKHRWIK